MRQLVGRIDAGLLRLGVAALLLLIAAVLPSVPFMRDTWRYLIFVDISQSMNARDGRIGATAVSRIDFSRQAIAGAIAQLPCGSQVGLGVFTQYRTLLMIKPVEICAHIDDVNATLANIGGRMRWNDSSEVAKGVSWAIRAARQVGDSSAVVFLTDGHEAPPLRADLPPIFDEVSKGITGGLLVGVGAATPAPIPRTDRLDSMMGYWRAEDVVQGPLGSDHLSARAQDYLMTLAPKAGLSYLGLDAVDDLGAALRDERFAVRAPVPTDLRWLPLGAALILLLWQYRPQWPQRRLSRPALPATQGVGEAPPVRRDSPRSRAP